MEHHQPMSVGPPISAPDAPWYSRYSPGQQWKGHYLHETVREIASGVSSLPTEVKSTILRTLPEHQEDPLLSIIKDFPVRP
ncbi:hypothetical protein DPMN_138815 [Dreissena polymorpha]|uniref:Uncharacterized protein n=1 Tax=Dreissena polymorpha TaxID=45954 RepID=A0A9D4JIX5_DREPO|nr:hypothetical protein DPMN_138815 [Dreissena polymorpha]